MHAQIELFGGPEDGREITLPVGTEGTPLSPLPVPSPRTGEDTGEESESPSEHEVAWYERHHRRRRDMWVYKYANSDSVHQPEST